MASRPTIVERNRYQPTEQQLRRAKRGYIQGTRMTIKKPGDYLFTESGGCFVIDRHGRAMPKTRTI